MSPNVLNVAFGGSAADPPHYGHLATLKAIRRSRRFDLVIWYLSGYSTFKSDITPAIHRDNMSKLAIDPNVICNPRDGGCPMLINVSDVYGEDTPTYQRLIAIRENYRRQGITAHVTFFTGADSVTPNTQGRLPIEEWYYSPELIKESLLIVSRPGFAQPDDVVLPDNIRWLPAKIPKIASSQIRGMIAAGDPEWKNLVPKRVAQYIELHGLYQRGVQQP